MTALTTTRTRTPLDAMAAFLSIEIRRALRNRRYVMFAIAFPIVFYALYTGVLSGASADANAPVGGTVWATYFMVSMATYGAIGAALGSAVIIAQERTSGWTRQLRVTPLRPEAYVLTKLVVSYLVTVPAVGGVLLTGLLMHHVALAPTAWIQLIVSLALGSLPFAALGLLLGYLFDASSAQGGMMISFFSLSILGGLWAPIETFPETLATIGRMLPSFRLADLGRAAVLGKAPDLADIAILAGYAIVIGGLAAWRYRASEQRASA